MKNINVIHKEKVVLKFILSGIAELKSIDINSLIPDTDYLKKSLEITFKGRDNLLIIDYIKTLKSEKSEHGGKDNGEQQRIR